MPEKTFPGILSTVGNTPLVRLERLIPHFGSRIFGKIERFNPGGSIKDRSALGMLLAAIRTGAVEPGRSVIVESSSGNLAVGLAQICRYFGLRFICVVDGKTTEQNRAILRAFRAEVEVITERDQKTGEFLPVRLRRVRELVAQIPDAYWPNQYESLLNPKAHETTMREIEESLDGRVDYLFCSVSTFGTLRGCRDHIRARGLDTTVVAVDAMGSAIFGLESTQRLIPGHGASVVPPLMDSSAADEVVHISDLECVVACRRLIAREAVLAGGSSGATVAALWKIRHRVPEGSNCVLIFPDGGDRYLDTIYSDSWVGENFGDVSHLWKD
ncbi:2,3-diaminopropionate biosynthesis protein SbnA [Streptomyces lacrimifluminis]|uniref:N-(2-amino-2-carboxyethyl)-L-glutamate synthase n=1 Tax=Streptomyces lacrimifluminis TaxID=1500077 RepID=A0A917P9E1_9ACTN|nr:2,3-diaminopropionate biosynthesis protein SbnA [Streptomyces lacrimifluminis]GGJ67480.1 2,3-diaminopropionate biosynthesis protein SbnA [Streptomyces lacrimifluminis]